MNFFDIKQYMIKLQPILDIDFGSIDNDIVKQTLWFNTLKNLATIDVSLAHIIQHDMGARMNISISQSGVAKQFLQSKPYGELTGSFSSPKFFDTCIINQSILSGTKMMCSNINADYHTFFIKNQGVVLLYKDTKGLELDYSFQPIGMEATETGNLILNNIEPDNYVLLNTVQDSPLHNKRLCLINLSFCTINLGLSIQLVRDLKKIVTQNNKADNQEIQHLEHKITVYNNLWDSLVYEMVNNTDYTTTYIKKILNLYSEGKDILANILHKFLLFGGGQNTIMGESSQRFRDALVYVTHRSSFYSSLNYETSSGHKFIVL